MSCDRGYEVEHKDLVNERLGRWEGERGRVGITSTERNHESCTQFYSLKEMLNSTTEEQRGKFDWVTTNIRTTAFTKLLNPQTRDRAVV